MATTPAGVLNIEVLKYAVDHKLKKVLTGECAELANEALKFAKAKDVEQIMGVDKVTVDADYIWGEEIMLAELEPGDIVQLRNYVIKWVVKQADGKVINSEESETHHTVIISSVVSRVNGIMNVLHQNSPQGKLVVEQELWFQDAEYTGDFNYMDYTEGKVYKKLTGKIDIDVTGTISCYRPMALPEPKK